MQSTLQNLPERVRFYKCSTTLAEPNMLREVRRPAIARKGRSPAGQNLPSRASLSVYVELDLYNRANVIGWRNTTQVESM